MFDCGSPTLVFITQTHHPVLEHHTGFLFGYYEFQFRKPKEMFFAHIHEAQVFALYREARLEMDPEQRPEEVTALGYSLAGQDESLFMHIPDMRTNHEKVPDSAGLAARKSKQAALDLPTDEQLTELDELLTAESPAIDWFGEE